jgi:hypothetical protein
LRASHHSDVAGIVIALLPAVAQKPTALRLGILGTFSIEYLSEVAIGNLGCAATAGRT